MDDCRFVRRRDRACGCWRLCGLLALLFAVSPASVLAQNCTVANWSSATNLADSATGTPVDGVARYESVCAVEVALDGAVRFLGDNSPAGLGGLSQYVARFYVNTAGASLSSGDSVVLFRGFDAVDGAGTKQFEVRLRNNGGALEGVLAAGGTTLSAGLAARAWHSLEMAWNAGTGEIDLIVDGQGSGGPAAASLSGTVESVRLGNLNGLNAGGTLGLDGFESHRSGSVGRLCPGDTNGDGQRDLEDVFAVFDEHATASNSLSALASGQPDFDENAVVDLDDVFAIFNQFALAQGGCP